MFHMFLQAYYLCYSLLDLTNEASNYEFLRPDQKVGLFAQMSFCIYFAYLCVTHFSFL